MDQFLIYKVTNLVNGHRYVGATGRTLRARRYGHVSEAKRGIGRLLGAAIRKHGVKAFRFETLKRGLTAPEAAAEEIRLISILKPEYNIGQGGEGIGGIPSSDQLKKFFAGRKRACEARKRPVICLNDGRRWKSVNEAAAAIGVVSSTVAESCRGRHTFIKGLRFAFDIPSLDIDAEVRRRDALQQYRKGHPKPIKRSTNIRQYRGPIVNIVDGNVYPSVKAAAIALMVTTGLVSFHCKNNSVSRSGRFAFRKFVQ